MKYTILTFTFLFCWSGFGQDSIRSYGHGEVKRFIPLKEVRNKGVRLTKEDSLDFKFHDSDTLVLIRKNLEPYFPKGVKVKIEHQDSSFLKKYEEVVYGSKDRKDRNKQSLKVWKEEIKIYFDSSVPEKHQTELMKFAARVSSEIDSLNIRKVFVRKNSNYLVFYRQDANDFDLDPRIKNSAVGYYLNWKNGKYFTRASLKVNSFLYSNKENLLQDVKMRFFQTLGYFWNSELVSCGNLLSTCGKDRSLSEEDIEILQYHYSYQNCIGIGASEFDSHHEYVQKRFQEHPYISMYVIHNTN